MTQTQDATLEFSLIRGDALFRAQQALGLIPAQGLGVIRRATFAVLVTWVPLMVAAAVANRLWPGAVDESLLQHFGVHVRFLVAIPLFIIDDAVAHNVFAEVVPHFVRSGLVPAAARGRFAAIVEQTTALRDGWRPWVVIGGVALAWAIATPVAWDAHELNWTLSDPPIMALRFATLWYRHVAEPIYVGLMLVWLWRLLLATGLMWRISGLDLALVPTHPDRAAGLGFLEMVPYAFVAPAFAIAAVLSAGWAHDVLYHDVPLGTLVVPLGTFVVVSAVMALVPLLVFVKPLSAVRHHALLDYGVLVGEHHRRLRRRWILGEALDDDAILRAPEIGTTADSIRLYDAIWAMWPLPVSKRKLLGVIVLIALPVLPLIGLEVHLGDALLKILQTLL